MAKAKTPKKRTPKKKPPKGRQGQIPGTERQEIESLTDAAEVLRKLKKKRKGLTSQIADAKAHMEAVVRTLIVDGEIKLPDKETIKDEVIYKYETDDGELEVVEWTVTEKGDVTSGSSKGGDEGE